jgi:tetratricopeptide (TPR) repeat protein
LSRTSGRDRSGAAGFGAEGHEATATIAWHLDQAGNPVEAARAWMRAGNHAMLLSEFDRAMRYYERVGEIDARRQDPYTWVQAIVGRGNGARALGDVPEALRTLTRAHRLARQEHLPAVQANALAAIGMLDFDAGRVHEGANRLRKAIELHLEAGDLPEACRSMARLSHNLHGMGHYDEAAAMARRGMALANELGHDMMYVGARIALTNCWIDLGFFEDAIRSYEECIAISSKHNDAHRENICLLNITLSACELEQWDRAETALQQLLEPGRTVVERFLGTAEYDLGFIAEGRGDAAAARDHYARSLDIRRQTEQHALMIDSLAGLLRIAVSEGQTEEIRRLRQEIDRRVEDRGRDGIEHVGRLYVTLVDAARALGDQRDAHAYVQAALAFLTDRAHLLADPAHRQSYLTNPPAHRRIMQLANVRG